MKSLTPNVQSNVYDEVTDLEICGLTKNISIVTSRE